MSYFIVAGHTEQHIYVLQLQIHRGPLKKVPVLFLR